PPLPGESLPAVGHCGCPTPSPLGRTSCTSPLCDHTTIEVSTMRLLDLAVIVVYLAVAAWIGLRLSGKQRDLKGYFLGDRDLPWWAVCLSVVATETSALTVISVPTIAYLGDVTFIQVALGYLLGRIVVAFVLLPRYYRGEMTTAYSYLGE